MKHQDKASRHKLLFKESRCEGEEVEQVADRAKHLCGNSHLESRPPHFCSLQYWMLNELSSGTFWCHSLPALHHPLQNLSWRIWSCRKSLDVWSPTAGREEQWFKNLGISDPGRCFQRSCWSCQKGAETKVRLLSRGLVNEAPSTKRNTQQKAGSLTAEWRKPCPSKGTHFLLSHVGFTNAWVQGADDTVDGQRQESGSKLILPKASLCAWSCAELSLCKSV